MLQLAGILLDTQNLNAYTKLSMARDAEAVQLLLVGSAPNYRNAVFDQCKIFHYYITSVTVFCSFIHHEINYPISGFFLSDARSKGQFLL